MVLTQSNRLISSLVMFSLLRTVCQEIGGAGHQELLGIARLLGHEAGGALAPCARNPQSEECLYFASPWCYLTVLFKTPRQRGEDRRSRIENIVRERGIPLSPQ